MKFLGVVIIGTLLLLGIRHYRWLHEWFRQWVFQWKQSWGGVVVGKFACTKEGCEIEKHLLELCYNQGVQIQEVTVSTWKRIEIGDCVKKRAWRSSVETHLLPQGEAQHVTSVLVERLSLPDNGVRLRTIEALGQMGVSGESVMSGLVKILKSDSVHLRCRAASVLGRFGEVPQVVVKALIEALSDGTARVRMNAAWALGEVDCRSATLVLALIEILKADKDPKVRFNSLQALKKKGTPEAIQGIKASRSVEI